MNRPTAVRWAMVALVVASGLWGAFSWSLIPVAIDAHVDNVGHHSGTGYRFYVLYLDDGRSLVVDRHVVDAMGSESLKGHDIEKDRWSSELRVGERSLSLRPSRAFWQVGASLVALSFLGLRPWRGRTDDADG